MTVAAAISGYVLDMNIFHRTVTRLAADYKSERPLGIFFGRIVVFIIIALQRSVYKVGIIDVSKYDHLGTATCKAVLLNRRAVKIERHIRR